MCVLLSHFSPVLLFATLRSSVHEDSPGKNTRVGCISFSKIYINVCILDKRQYIYNIYIYTHTVYVHTVYIYLYIDIYIPHFVFPNGRISFFYDWIMLSTYIFFIHSFVGEQSACLHVLSIVNNATTNVEAQMCLWYLDFMSFRCISRSRLLSHMVL